jgi:zinc transport system substrate-binding protein
MNMKKILASIVLVTVIVAGVLFAINQNKSAGQDTTKLQVTASYYPLYDFAKNVGGDKVQVANMTPAGAEPHDYEPSPKALTSAQKATVFIYNGGHLEPWVNGFLGDYKKTAIKASTGINLTTTTDAANAGEQVQDPHFWLDPILAQHIINTIRDGLVTADPANKGYYIKNASEYNLKLAQLDTDFRQGLATCSIHTIISSHDAFSYLGKRYGLHIASIAGLSPDEEPSAAKLAELSQLVTSQGIKYVFFESLVSPRLADTIATETGAKTLVFDPIEGLTDADQKQGKNYITVQRENLANLRTALACQ